MSRSLPKTTNVQQQPVLQALVTSFNKHILSHTKSTIKPTLWLTCSGGRDSLGLVHAISVVKQLELCEIDLNLKVIHVNHDMQSFAGAWQHHVESFCELHGLDYVCEQVALTQNANEKQARDARFQAFYQHIQANDILVLGHHADDQAETVLMNLCKGTGLKGLSGMQEYGTYEGVYDNETFVHKRWRPWLSVTRAEITDFCRWADIAFIDDPTNVNGDNTRAFIRREIMPKLQQKWQQASANIARSASIVSESKEIVDAQIEQDIQKVMSSVEHTELPVHALLDLPQERQSLLLSRWLQGHAHYAPPRHIVLQIMVLAQTDSADVAETNTQITWQKIQIKRYDDILYKLPLQCVVANQETLQITAEDINQRIIKLTSGLWKVCMYSDSEAGLHIDLLNKHLTVRPVETGERLHIEGRVGSWPIKKFFQSIRLPSWQRKQAQVLCADELAVAIVCAKGLFRVQSFTCSSEHMVWSLQRVSSVEY